jgi:hypothetical protein
LQILPHQFASGTGKSNGSVMIENARLFAQLRDAKNESRFLVILQVGLRPLLGFAPSDRSASILLRSAPGQRI